MKKSFVALALAGAFSGAAQAESTVEIYGIVDMGFVRETGDVPGLTNPTSTTPTAHVAPGGNKLTSGAQSGTRLGFKGTEDLGGGLKGLFVLETGIAAARGGFNQGNAAFARQSFVGLQGNFGTLTLGRQYTPYFLAMSQVGDPFASGLSGAAQNLMLAPFMQSTTAPGTSVVARPNQGIRMDNTVKYTSPIFSGISGEIAYGFGEVTGSNTAGRVISAAIGYSAKPANVRLAYYRANASSLSAPDATSSVMVTGNWDFGVAKVHAAYADSDEFFNRKFRDYLIGASIPFGPHTVLLSYIFKDDRSALNRDASQIAIGYTYALSKRTNLYASWANIDNKRGAIYSVGNNSETGTGDSAFNLGVRHMF